LVRYVREVDFQTADYGPEVARILDQEGGGKRAMDLAPSGCISPAARSELQNRTARDLFPNARSPEGALSGLYLYFSCLDEAHSIAQDLPTVEGSYWHGIMHRQEPDPGNAKYWFDHVGQHPIFPALRDEARQIGYDAGLQWDPFQFIDFCESARRRPGSEEEAIAKSLQLMEWQLLFDFCAHPAGEKTR
jgi:hypothetical protein